MNLLACFVLIIFVAIQLNLRRMYLTRIKNSAQHFHISSSETSELVVGYSYFKTK